jgi:hypothetical protein
VPVEDGRASTPGDVLAGAEADWMGRADSGIDGRHAQSRTMAKRARDRFPKTDRVEGAATNRKANIPIVVHRADGSAFYAVAQHVKGKQVCVEYSPGVGEWVDSGAVRPRYGDRLHPSTLLTPQSGQLSRHGAFRVVRAARSLAAPRPNGRAVRRT